MRERFNKRRLMLLAAVALLVLAFGALCLTRNMALAQAGRPASALAEPGNGGYDLGWNTIDGGGGMSSTGGSYTLRGTIGQSDAGRLAGGAYTLAGGFWNVRVLRPYRVYLPIVLRND